MKEKINFYVSDETADTLFRDAENFEVFKSDMKTINKNKFLSLVLKGYYSNFIDEYNQKRNLIVSNLSSCLKDDYLIDSLSSKIVESCIFPSIPKKKGKHSVPLSLKPTRESETALTALEDTFSTYSKSSYLNWIISSYCSLPIYKREKIVFKLNYELIQEAITMNYSLKFKTIWNKDKVHNVMPYRIVASKDELYNYLLCAEIIYENGKQKQIVSTYRLNRLSNVSLNNIRFQIDQTTKNNIVKTIQYNPKFVINESLNAIVKLNKKGLMKVRRIYQDRPANVQLKKENEWTYMTFDGSVAQLELYLKKIGPDAIVVEPEYLRKKLEKYYEESYYAYKGDCNELQ